MWRTSVDVEGLHHAGAPIPAASLVGSLLFSSGINGMDPTDGSIPEDPETQVALVFDNIRRILEQAGGTLGDVAKCTFFVRDRSLKTVIDDHWLKAFPDPASRPARHTLVQELTVQALQCEIVANIERLAR
ncbi:RidA family protein [Pseudonocardia sp. GCM10023141]|uniref:RidA family protein n=1 Tax=Pseudonocardia sp. GCM10023141 TaxID=3252653 RepID=UPI0036221831